MPTSIIILELLLKYGPAVAAAAREIIKIKDPTDEDWRKLFAVAETSYDSYIEAARKRAGQ